MLYLASASPRRQELLRQVGIAFEVMPANIIETRKSGEAPNDYVKRVAADKARSIAQKVKAQGKPRAPVLGADTEVIVDDEVLGKPRDRAHGLAMLARLAGRRHQVASAVVVIDGDRELSAMSESFVTFESMSARQIEEYWDSGEPVDKAGGYAVQGLAARYIRHIEGSFSGIVGLPLYELEKLLTQIQYRRP